jgi:hypothetical protein
MVLGGSIFVGVFWGPERLKRYDDVVRVPEQPLDSDKEQVRSNIVRNKSMIQSWLTQCRYLVNRIYKDLNTSESFTSEILDTNSRSKKRRTST